MEFCQLGLCDTNVNLSHLIGEKITLTAPTAYYWTSTRKYGGKLNAAKIRATVIAVSRNRNGYWQIYFDRAENGAPPFFMLWENIDSAATGQGLSNLPGRNWFNVGTDKVSAFARVNSLIDAANKAKYKTATTPTPATPRPEKPADEETPTALKVSSASFGTLGIVLIGLYFLQKIRNKRK